MSTPLTAEQQAELERRAFAFNVKWQGAWDAAAQADFRGKMLKKGIEPDEPTLIAALELGRRRFHEGSAHLFVCCGGSCGPSHEFDDSPEAVQQTAQRLGLPVTIIACQGNCKHSPNAVMRVGDKCVRLSHFPAESDWQKIQAYAQRAAESQTPHLNDDPAVKFFYDGPVEKE